MDDAVRLEAQAVGLMKDGDFGDNAIRVNQSIVALAPQNDRARTRLGRNSPLRRRGAKHQKEPRCPPLPSPCATAC